MFNVKIAGIKSNSFSAKRQAPSAKRQAPSATDFSPFPHPRFP
jgi:hypothetical protein